MVMGNCSQEVNVRWQILGRSNQSVQGPIAGCDTGCRIHGLLHGNGYPEAQRTRTADLTHLLPERSDRNPAIHPAPK